MIGSDKEIRLSKLPVDGNNTSASVEYIDEAIDRNYTKEQQSNILLIGHAHHRKLSTSDEVNFPEFNQWFKGRDARFMSLGRPSSPRTNDNGDFGPYLYRSPTDANRGQSAALIVTPYGFTIYGTATSSYPNAVSGRFQSNGHIQPGIESYFRYKQIKK